MKTGPGIPRVRFAPSPTGSLHLGNARTALFNWLEAGRTGGCLVLRIEDTDVDRQQEGSEQGILDDLRWLGLSWDEGPQAGGVYGPYRQSERQVRYDEAARKLLDRGLAYRCFCTEAQLEAEREDQKQRHAPQRYSRRCRSLSADESDRRAAEGEAFVVRLDVQAAAGGDAVVGFDDLLRGRVEFPTVELSDLILVRRDDRSTYNLAVVVDDAEMKIDLVLRGDDHLSNTPRQALLYRGLGCAPPRFAHLPMVRGTDGSRLSKRHGAVSVAEYRRRGYPASALLNALVLLGWSPREERTILTRDQMLAEFDLRRINRSPSTFDPDKLDWISNQHIKAMPVDELAREVGRRLVEAGRLPEHPAAAGDWLAGIAELVRASLNRFDQIVERAAGIFHRGGIPQDEPSRGVLAGDAALDVVAALARAVAEHPPGDTEGWQRVKKAVAGTTGLKGKALFQPMRVAITGRATGPELDRLAILVTRGNGLFPDRVVTLEERCRRTTELLK